MRKPDGGPGTRNRAALRSGEWCAIVGTVMLAVAAGIVLWTADFFGNPLEGSGPLVIACAALGVASLAISYHATRRRALRTEQRELAAEESWTWSSRERGHRAGVSQVAYRVTAVLSVERDAEAEAAAAQDAPATVGTSRRSAGRPSRPSHLVTGVAQATRPADTGVSGSTARSAATGPRLDRDYDTIANRLVSGVPQERRIAAADRRAQRDSATSAGDRRRLPGPALAERPPRRPTGGEAKS